MKNKYLLMLMTTGFITLQACQKEQSNKIEELLVPHLEMFELEASKHGLNIDITSIDLNAYIEEIEDSGTLGQCKSYGSGQQDIVISIDYWEKSSYLEREYVVFHELGHCLLDKSHNDESNANGNCLSIMQSGLGLCRKYYDSENRDQLIAELFN